MSRALVTGGTGFVGARLVDRLLESGWRVEVLNRGRTLPPERLPAGVTHVCADRRDHTAVASALAGREYDAVFDVAAYRPDDVASLLAVTHAGAYVLISTVVVYEALHGERGGDRPIREDAATVAPFTGDGDLGQHYPAYKRACELVALESSRAPAAVLRPCGIYGEGDRWYRHDYFFDRLALGRPVLVPDSHWDRFVHLTGVAGLVDACLLAAAPRGGGHLVLNVADEAAETCSGLARLCAGVAGVDAPVLTYPAGLPEQLLGAGAVAAMPRGRFVFGPEPTFRLDCARAREALGWTPPALREGTAALHRDHRRRLAAGLLEPPDLRLDDALLACL